MNPYITLLLTVVFLVTSTLLTNTCVIVSQTALVFGITTAILTLVAVFTSHAPIGYQDKNGFHYGKPKQLNTDA